MLSLKQLNDFCLVNSGNYKKCRYLGQDKNDRSKWFCLKKSSKKDEIDDEVDEFLRDAKKKGLNVKKQGIPVGDNCEGYPILRHLEQGYDK